MDTVPVKEVIEIFNKLPESKKHALYQFAHFLHQSSLESDLLFQKTIEDIRLNRSRSISSSKEIEQPIEELESIYEIYVIPIRLFLRDYKNIKKHNPNLYSDFDNFPNIEEAE